MLIISLNFIERELIEMSLFNYDSNMSGIYRAIMLEPYQDKIKVYIPSITNNRIPCPLYTDGTLNKSIYETNIDSYLSASWAVPKSINNTGEMCWVVFESGNINYPTIVGYIKDEIVINAYSDNVTNSLPELYDNNYTFSANGVTKDIVFTSSRTNTMEYLVLHSVAAPGATASSIINGLKNQGLGIHGIVTSEGVIQTAEWNVRLGHIGPMFNGTSIGFEMLESPYVYYDSGWNGQLKHDHIEEIKSFHDSIYNHAVNIFAQLSKELNISIDKILSHNEISHIPNSGTDHGDPESLWNTFKNEFQDSKWTMDGFRSNVEKVKNTL